MIEWFFRSGHAADVVLVVLAIEAAILMMKGWSWRVLAGMLGPAVLLVLGVRAALVGADWYWIALPLALSFPLHLLDLSNRTDS